MKVVILAGGLGTRISEESHLKPKPMIEIGEQPILWHIMKLYSAHGYNDFIICLGYKSYAIKQYFADYFLHKSDVSFDLQNNHFTILNNYSEPWKVTLIDTGIHTMTGGRVKRIQQYIGNEHFMLTYGDGVADINIPELEKFHISHGKIATITAVKPEGRFGMLEICNDCVNTFHEKPKNGTGWINGGFMVFSPDIFDYLESDTSVLEGKPFEDIASQGELMAYKHRGFWQCMDTQRDKQRLEELWEAGAPWKIW